MEPHVPLALPGLRANLGTSGTEGDQPDASDRNGMGHVMIQFHEQQGTYSGVGTHGRRWRISQTSTGWRLEFSDPGDVAATYAGTHVSVTAAKDEASR